MILRPLCDIFRQTEEFNTLRKALADRSGDDAPVLIEGIAPASFPLIAATVFNDEPRQTIVVAENYQKMHEMHLDLSSLVDESQLYVFPPWETLPYEFVSAPETTERERITALYRIIRGETGAGGHHGGVPYKKDAPQGILREEGRPPGSGGRVSLRRRRRDAGGIRLLAGEAGRIVRAFCGQGGHHRHLPALA